jgi:predicted GNAT family acetyltransferase
MFNSLFFNDASPFLADIFPFLSASIMPNNMILGMTEAAVSTTASSTEFIGLVVYHNDKFAGTALSTRPGWLCLSQSNEGAVAPLLKAWIDAHGKPAHVFGPEPTITLAIKILKDVYQMTPTTRQKNLAYELLKVVHPAKPAQGKMRMAVDPDLSFLPQWEERMIIDCKLPEAVETGLRERCKASAKKFVDGKKIAIWEDANGTPVSMCRKAREASFGTSVSGVYTPDALRGHGYASHLVALFSQKLLDEGAPRCLLFTDAENPTSNGIYQRIGYNYCCDFCRADY